MNGYYIFLMFIVSFALAFVTKILLNEKLENMVHTMESLMILLAVILFLCGTNQYYVGCALDMGEVKDNFQEVLNELTD